MGFRATINLMFGHLQFKDGDDRPFYFHFIEMKKYNFGLFHLVSGVVISPEE